MASLEGPVDANDPCEVGLFLLDRLVTSGQLVTAWKIRDMLRGMEVYQAAWTLLWAKARGWVHAAQQLRDAGADVFARDSRGNTLLHSAAWDGQPIIVYFIVEAEKGLLERTNNFRQTALHAAALKGHAECLKLLLLHGADVNAKARRGHTALHLAALYDRPQCVDMLLSFGASAEARDNRGRSALQICDIKHHNQCREVIFRSAAANGRILNYET